MEPAHQTWASANPERPIGAPPDGFAPSSVVRNVQTIAELEARSTAKRSSLDRLSDRVSDFASSPSFLVIHIVWFAGWVLINAFVRRPLDPYPYTFLTFLVSLEAIFLTSFVLISQKHLEGQAHRRAALDLQINLLAEQEMTTVLRTVSAIARHLKIADAPGSDEEIKELAERTDVVAIANSVEAHEDGAPCESAGQDSSVEHRTSRHRHS
jgi:uncharacterized membrane protein